MTLNKILIQWFSFDITTSSLSWAWNIFSKIFRRTLVKAYGLKFLVVIDGQASKFDLKNTVIVLVTGLGLLGLSTMFCDFILLNYSTDRSIVSTFYCFLKLNCLFGLIQHYIVILKIRPTITIDIRQWT